MFRSRHGVCAFVYGGREANLLCACEWMGLLGAMLEYRLDRLAGAAQNSAETGWGGTRIPWESAVSGLETCPLWAATGTQEIHINGDVSFAIRQMYYLTRDLGLLKDYYPLLAGIADYWCSRCTPSDNGMVCPVPAFNFSFVLFCFTYFVVFNALFCISLGL